MKPRDSYGVQTFIRDRKGEIAKGLAVACRSADEARREAERRAGGWPAIGAAVFCRSGVGDQDEGEAITIATYGTVPPGVTDTLPF
nr:hypothetical protein NG677_04465 [Methylobacterium sp. OTU13CASTA1]